MYGKVTFQKQNKIVWGELTDIRSYSYMLCFLANDPTIKTQKTPSILKFIQDPRKGQSRLIQDCTTFLVISQILNSRENYR